MTIDRNRELHCHGELRPGAADLLKERVAIICIGNLYMRDDGVGIRAAEALRRRELGPHVSVHEQTEMDFTIIQEVQGASKVIIIDALRGGKEPGAVTKYRFNLRKDDLSELPSLHSLQLSEILDLAAKAEILKCPVIIIGVEPKDDTLGEQMSSEVQSALPKVLDSVAGELSET